MAETNITASPSHNGAYAGPTVDETLAMALGYCERGLRLVPVFPGSPDKEPYFKCLRRTGRISASTGRAEWTSLRSHPATPDEIREWFWVDPAVSLAAITGCEPLFLTVIDIDHLEIAPRFEHSPTAIVRASRGPHVWLSADGPILSQPQFAQGRQWGEIRGAGVYSLLPPAIHHTDYVYAWEVPLNGHLAHISDCRGLDFVSQPKRPRPRRNVTRTPGDPGSLFSSSRTVIRTAEGESPLGADSSLARGSPTTSGCPGDTSVTPASALAAHVLANEDMRTQVLLTVGIPENVAAPHSNFPCVIPGHTDETASCSIAPDSLVYCDWHCPTERTRYSIAEIYAYSFLGREIDRLSKPTAARWFIRLCAHAGVVALDLSPPDLPRTIGDAARRAAEGFMVLRACRAFDVEPGPTPYAADFIATWCGLTEIESLATLKYLRRHGLIECVAQYRENGRTLNLYVEGQKWS